MVSVHLHLRSGRTLAYDLDDEQAHGVVLVVRERWQHPDPAYPDIGLGQGDDIDTWVRVDQIEAVELVPIPADPVGGT